MNANKYKLNKQQQQQRLELANCIVHSPLTPTKVRFLRHKQQQQQTRMWLPNTQQANPNANADFWSNNNNNNTNFNLQNANQAMRNAILYQAAQHNIPSSSNMMMAPSPPTISNANFRNFNDNFASSNRSFEDNNISKRQRQLDEEFERARANARRHNVFPTIASANTNERSISNFSNRRLEIDSDRDRFDEEALLRAQRRLLEESATTTTSAHKRHTSTSRFRKPSPTTSTARARNFSPKARARTATSRRKRTRSPSPVNINNNNKHMKPDIITVILTSKDPNIVISQSKLSLLSEVLIAEFTTGHALKPKFHGIYFKTNKLLLDCETKETVEWLKLVVPRLKNWQGPEIEMIVGNDKSKSKIGKNVRLQLQRSSHENPKSLLSIIEAQNEGINTSSWVILSQQDKAGYKLLDLQIDDASWRTIQKSNGSLYYRFGKVQVEEITKEARRR